MQKNEFMRIEKKTWPEYFQLILEGKKTYDLRIADFECNEGDILVLQEWDPETKSYTGREMEKEISYVGKTKNFKFWEKNDLEKYGLQCMALKNKRKIAKETFEEEIEICRKMHKEKEGCNWGKCENCGVLPLLQKLCTGKLIEDRAELEKYKAKILK